MIRLFILFAFGLLIVILAAPPSWADEDEVLKLLRESSEARAKEREPVAIPAPGGIDWFYGKWYPLNPVDIDVIDTMTLVPGNRTYVTNDGEIQQHPYLVIDVRDRMVLLGFPIPCESNRRVPKGSKRCMTFSIFGVYAEKVDGWTNLFDEILLNFYGCKYITIDETGLDVAAIRRVVEKSFCGDVMHRGVRDMPGGSLVWLGNTTRFVRVDKLGFPSDPIHNLGQ